LAVARHRFGEHGNDRVTVVRTPREQRIIDRVLSASSATLQVAAVRSRRRRLSQPRRT
jgi:hypothetical protein